jgi:hypothetical protein
LDKHACQACRGIPTRFIQDGHNHIFGLECFNKTIETFGRKCPVSNHHLQAIVGSESGLDEDYLVSCPSSRLCFFKGKLSELPSHLEIDCQHFIENCPKQGCNYSSFRRDVQAHISECLSTRTVKCFYCSCECNRNEFLIHKEICLARNRKIILDRMERQKRKTAIVEVQYCSKKKKCVGGL